MLHEHTKHDFDFDFFNAKNVIFSSATLHGTNWPKKNISFKIIILDALILLL